MLTHDTNYVSTWYPLS